MSQESNNKALVIQENLLPQVPDYILTEVFLENTGYFTPSSKTIKDVRVKEKPVGEKTTADGVKKIIKVIIRASGELGLPITSDLDYYRAFLKICDNIVDSDGRFHLPIKVSSYQLAKIAGKKWNNQTRKEIKAWLQKMNFTGITGGMYRAKTKDYDDGFSGVVFSQVIYKGGKVKEGTTADANYIWPAPWWLSNYFYNYVKPIDFNLYLRLRKPIAKALYSLLENGWYASKGTVYAKSYEDLCSEFLLTPNKYLSDIKKQLDPSHEELKKEQFLRQWEYSEGKTGLVIKYYPGEKFFEDQKARAKRKQLSHIIEVTSSKEEGSSRKKKYVDVPPDLIDEFIRITGDNKSLLYLRKLYNELPEGMIWGLISETKQAKLEGRIKTTAARYFTDLAQRALANASEKKKEPNLFSS